MEAEIRIELGEPNHGWMAVRFRVGADEWQCHASYVFDCVTDLVYAALELTESREARPVIFFEEPSACRLSITGLGDVVHVTITKHQDVQPTPNAHNGTIVLSVAVSRASLTKAIWSAVHQLEVTTGTQRFEAEWRTPFPAKELAQLRERIA